MALGDRRSGMVLGAGQKRCLGTEGGVCGVDLAVAGMEDAGSVCAPELRGCTRCLVRGEFDAGLCGGGGDQSDDLLAVFDRGEAEVHGLLGRLGVKVPIAPGRAIDRDNLHDVTADRTDGLRSEEHTSELQSLMRISYAVF